MLNKKQQKLAPFDVVMMLINWHRNVNIYFYVLSFSLLSSDSSSLSETRRKDTHPTISATAAFLPAT
jgi:hypothetical protein